MNIKEIANIKEGDVIAEQGRKQEMFIVLSLREKDIGGTSWQGYARKLNYSELFNYGVISITDKDRMAFLEKVKEKYNNDLEQLIRKLSVVNNEIKKGEKID